MRISDIRQPDLFQRVVQRLYVAEHGHGLQVVDDSAGDRGNDGYDPERQLLMAIYCPEKDLTEAKALKKGRRDLAKAVRLLEVAGYRFETWVFVTPVALPEKVQATLRAEAQRQGLTAQFLSGMHLEDIYLRHAELQPVFPELDYPRVSQELAGIRATLNALTGAPPGAAGPVSTAATAGDGVHKAPLPASCGRPALHLRFSAAVSAVTCSSEPTPAGPGPSFWLCGLAGCGFEVWASHALYAAPAAEFVRAVNSASVTSLNGQAALGLALVSLLGLQALLMTVLGAACAKRLLWYL